MSEKILLVEDEEKLARFVELELVYEGYQVKKAADGREGLALFEAERFDLILLDVMLPGIGGFEVLRRIRKTSSLPVIMLTARDAVMDKVAGLDGGADDYVTKPFAIEELLARIRTALRKQTATTSLQVGQLSIDPARRTAKYGETELDLTKREFDLLFALMESHGIVLTREVLLDRVWGYNYQGETNSPDVYIRFLRGKIDEAFGVKYIHTVRGVGYVLKEG
ncbi:MAG: response regulator transcription factor [Oscillospiraceae bacterium]|nr:response regulator transcription factor [Oscillospiraceae bacterium]